MFLKTMAHVSIPLPIILNTLVRWAIAEYIGGNDTSSEMCQ